MFSCSYGIYRVNMDRAMKKDRGWISPTKKDKVEEYLFVLKTDLGIGISTKSPRQLITGSAAVFLPNLQKNLSLPCSHLTLSLSNFRRKVCMREKQRTLESSLGWPVSQPNSELAWS